ncbi:MAG: N-6 DNA methylase [Candidatus Cloacimonadota bacterium]
MDKHLISKALEGFTRKDFYPAVLNFWNTLGYISQRQLEDYEFSFAEFQAVYSQTTVIKEEKALAADWKKLYFLFQVTDEELKNHFGEKPAFTSSLKSYLFAAIELVNADYNRTRLADLARQINRCYAIPLILTIKHGAKITIAVVNRRENKRHKDKDVLEKVTLIKDIDLIRPHRAHIEILHDLAIENLSGKYSLNSFDDLHRAWASVLDSATLGKVFYEELKYWFLWAVKNVRFPKQGPDYDLIDDHEYQKLSVIRLLTRFMFCWFLKEKGGLLPNEFFDIDQTLKLLKDFQPEGEESQYYQAILQNLYFTILSVPHDKRRFIRQAQYPNPDHGDKQVFRYQSMFRDHIIIQELFSSIPFLNGGLFDCLDKVSPGKPETVVDGFSETQKRRAVVPNKLFFGTAQVDLSQETGKAKDSNVSVRGLVRLFQHHKFTVEENTPIDEEIALDPTLLGMAFEELLAYYNPETNEAAKKQTGSFYTPPDIADYMVNQSLRAYLENYMISKGGMNKADIDTGLDILLAYTEQEHAFSKNETKLLVRAVDECKVIDPACGSGAFLMGTLQRMVYLLQKLDPKNEFWFDYMLEPVPSHMKEEMRKRLGKENYTYQRKLGLIQKCIYGVDIQAIAIQIAKLRFFLTLLIEQDIRHNESNHGIKELPNLEFKLVCADSLLKLLPEQTDNNDSQIEMTLETPGKSSLLEDINKYFNESDPVAKATITSSILKRIDAVALEHNRSIDSALINAPQGNKKQAKITERFRFMKAQWESYHGIFNNRTIQFFEFEYLFPDVKEGFDIVIGNPPYIALAKAMIKDKTKLYQMMDYSVIDGSGDIYCLFYERGLEILKPGGTLCFITSNKWMRSGYGKELRKLLRNEASIHNLVDFGGYQVFKTATVDTNIILLSRQAPSPKHKTAFCTMKSDYNGEGIEDYLKANSQKIEQASLQDQGWTLGESKVLLLKEKIEQIGKPLKEWGVNIYRGVLTGFNEAFIIDTPTKERLCNEDPKSSDILKPVLRGRDIQRFSYRWAGLWLIATFPSLHIDINCYPAIYRYLASHGNRLDQSGLKGSRKKTNNAWFETQDTIQYHEEFKKGKISWAETLKIYTNGRRNYPRFAWSPEDFYHDKTTFIMISDSPYFLLGVLNSALCGFMMDTYYITKLGEWSRGLQGVAIDRIPIPVRSNENSSIINQISEISKQIVQKTEDSEDTAELELSIDNLVFDLYSLDDAERNLVHAWEVSMLYKSNN